MEADIDYDAANNKHDPRHCHCASCKVDFCRQDFCNHEFSIRFEGIEDSLTYRIYELLWSKVEIELDNGNKTKGTLSFVGFNFVEIHSDENDKKRAHEKGQSAIFIIDEIVNIKLIEP